MKAALRADILAARRLLPVAALWAFLRRVGLVDFLGCDSSKLGFVLDHPGKLAIGPLVQPLIHLAAVVGPITDAANVTDCDRRDTSPGEHLHDLPAQFMKKVRDLAFDVTQLLILRFDQLFPAVRPAFFSVDLRVEFGFESVLVVPKSPKLPAVDREGIFACEDSSKMFLTEVDPGDFVSSRSVDGLGVVLSTDNEAAGTLPDLNGSRFRIHRPVDQDRVLSSLRGQTKHAVLSKCDSLVGPPQDVVSLVATLRRIAFPATLMPRADAS